MAQFNPSNNTVEVRIPIVQRTTSVLEQDYGGSGGSGQFADEMRKMEEEMSKLTGQINEGNQRIASRIIKTTTTTTRTTSGTGTSAAAAQPQPAIQYQQPAAVGGAVNNVAGNAQSHSTHTSTYSHETSGTGNNQGQPQQQQQPPSSVQWASPTPSGGLQQQQQQFNNTSTFTQQQQNTANQFPPQPAAASQQQHSSQHTTTSSTRTTTSHHGTTSDQQTGPGFSQQQNLDAANSQELQQWMGQLNSPLIHSRQDIAGQDGKCLRLRFDVSQYAADEISVKTVDGKLRVHAKHEEKSEHKSAYREFNKEFSLPIGTDPAAIKSTLSKDGILTVEAPLPGLGQQPAIANY